MLRRVFLLKRSAAIVLIYLLVPTSNVLAEPLPLFNTTNLTIPIEKIYRAADIDAIPAITDPALVGIDVPFCLADQRVIGVSLGGESRAYSVGMMANHEIINDTLGGVPISVTYCPLVDSVTVFERRMGEEILEFGVSGNLYNSNLVFYDRGDMSLWSQLLMSAVSGPHAGESLPHVPHEVVEFADWAAEHPDSTFVTDRPDGPYFCPDNRYHVYFGVDSLIRYPVSGLDDRFPNKSHIVGIVADDIARAYPFEELRKLPGGRLEETFPGGDLILEVGDAWGEVSVLSVPDDVEVVAPSFWFSWAAIHPETEVFSVPSPGTLPLLMWGALVMLLGRRRNRQGGSPMKAALVLAVLVTAVLTAPARAGLTFETHVEPNVAEGLDRWTVSIVGDEPTDMLSAWSVSFNGPMNQVWGIDSVLPTPTLTEVAVLEPEQRALDSHLLFERGELVEARRALEDGPGSGSWLANSPVDNMFIGLGGSYQRQDLEFAQLVIPHGERVHFTGSIANRAGGKQELDVWVGVPEPAMLLLLAIGAAAAACFRRRRPCTG